MTETRVVHIKDNIDGAVYVGRAMGRQGLKASPFANPYKIGDTSYYNPGEVFANGVQDERAPLSRIDVLNRYSRRIVDKPDLLAMLPDLRGKPLACWCRHDEERRTSANLCHADVLVQLLDRYTDGQLRYTAASEVALQADWTLRQKPVGTIQRFVKRNDVLLFGDEPPEMDIAQIGQMVIDALRAANVHGVKLDDLLAAHMTHRFAEIYGDPREMAVEMATTDGVGSVINVQAAELWRGVA